MGSNYPGVQRILQSAVDSQKNPKFPRENGHHPTTASSFQKELGKDPENAGRLMTIVRRNGSSL